MKISLLFSAAMLCSFLSFAQASGDYRSVASGPWNALSTWERYNGTTWVAPSGAQGYPGQNPGNAGVVTLQNNFDVQVTATVPNAVGSLLVGQATAGFAGLFFSGANNSGLMVTGDLNIIAGDIFIDPLPGAITYMLAIGGNLTVSNATPQALDLVNGDDVVNVAFNGTNQTIGGAGYKGFNNISFANIGTITVATNINVIAGVMSVSSNSTVSPAASARLSTDATGGSITGNGTLAVTQLGAASLSAQYNFAPATINVSLMRVNYAGAGAQAINSNVGNYGSLSTSGSGTKTAAGNITIADGVTVGTGTSLALGANDINTAGSLVVNGTVTPGTGEFNFNGLAAQTLSGTLSFYDVNVSNPSGIVFNSNATIANQLTLTSGILTLAAGTTTTLSSGLPVAGTGFGILKHINTQVNTGTGAMAFLRVSGMPASTPFTFPVGTGLNYLPAIITPAGVADFSVNAYTGITSNGLPNGTPVSSGSISNAVNAVWFISQTTGFNMNLRLEWPTALEGAAFAALADGQIGISRNNAGNWEVASGSGNQGLNFATRAGITSFGAFSVGQVGVALPVNLANVKAYPKNNGVQIEWSNLTEKDVLSYTVERSTDGRTFSDLDRQTARGNNSGKEDYTVMDAQPASGANFYRIKVNEASGKVSYSNVLRVDIGLGQHGLVVYPNPVRDGQLNIRLNTPGRAVFNLRLINATGQQVYQSTINNPGSGITETIQLPASLKAGRYTILVTDGTIKHTQAVVIQ